VPGDRLGILIADVTGKGIPAAMFMTLCRTLIRAESRAGQQPASVLQEVNRQLSLNSRSGVFVTVFYGILDVVLGHFTYASGGHDYPIWTCAADDTCTFLQSKGKIIGAFSEIELEQNDIALGDGDALVLYTDGITEARSTQNDLYGESRLMSVVQGNASESAEQLLNTVVNSVNEFVGETPQSDDYTILIVRKVAR